MLPRNKLVLLKLRVLDLFTFASTGNRSAESFCNEDSVGENGAPSQFHETARPVCQADVVLSRCRPRPSHRASDHTNHPAGVRPGTPLHHAAAPFPQLPSRRTPADPGLASRAARSIDHRSSAVSTGIATWFANFRKALGFSRTLSDGVAETLRPFLGSLSTRAAGWKKPRPVFPAAGKTGRNCR